MPMVPQTVESYDDPVRQIRHYKAVTPEGLQCHWEMSKEQIMTLYGDNSTLMVQPQYYPTNGTSTPTITFPVQVSPTYTPAPEPESTEETPLEWLDREISEMRELAWAA